MTAMSLMPRLRLGRLNRGLLALAISIALVGLAMVAITSIASALRALLAARAVYDTVAVDAGWFYGGGSAIAGGRWPWGATAATILLGGGLMTTGLYGLRTGVQAIGSLVAGKAG